VNSYSFPPADDLVSVLSEIDYQKHFNKYMDIVETVVMYIAAICVVIWERLQTMKFKTPDLITNWFYFSVNFIGEQGDEIIGLSVGNRYIGFYGDSINWGVLDEHGCL
jgi:hypothetical protein